MAEETCERVRGSRPGHSVTILLLLLLLLTLFLIVVVNMTIPIAIGMNIVNARKVPRVSPPGKGLVENLVELDDAGNEPHLETVREDGVLGIVRVEGVTDDALERGGDLTQVGALGLFVAAGSTHGVELFCGKLLGSYEFL